MSVISRFGVDEDDLLGSGGESDVFAIDADRVLRVMRPGSSAELVNARRELLRQLQLKASDVSFSIPEVLDVIEEDGEIATVETRMSGEPMSLLLARDDVNRRNIVRAYLLASREIGRLTPDVDFYGDLIRGENIRTHSFVEYAIARAHQSLRMAGEDFAGISALEIAGALLEGPKALLHLDYCPDNVLVEGETVSAVLDFGTVPIIGDRRIEPIAATLYLDPEITPSARDEDRELAALWLKSNELAPMVEPVRRWLAAFWSCAVGDKQLHAWCRRALLDTR